MAHPLSLLEKNLDHLLDTRGGDDLLDDNALVPPEHKLDNLTHHPNLHTKIGKNHNDKPIPLPKQTQQEILGAYVVVVGPLRLLLGEGEHLLRTLNEPFERIHGSETSYGKKSRDRA